MDCWNCLYMVVGLVIVYKTLDWLIRLPYIGSYSQRHILVTGCDTGFGYTIVKYLDGMGCHVYAGCFTDKGETELRKQCSERLLTFHLDVRNHDSVLKGSDFVKSKLPSGAGLWGVLNNAGVPGKVGRIEWHSVSDYQETVDVNLYGLIDVTMTFLPLVKQARGRVVNTSSAAGRFTLPHMIPYTVSKYGVQAFSDGLRRSVKEFGVSVHIIEPGMYNTTMNAKQAIVGSIEASWSNTSTEVQHEFGDEYFNKYKDSTFATHSATLKSGTASVAHAYQHALLAMFPRARYGVGWDMNYVIRPLSLLPEWLSDWLILNIYIRNAPVPVVVNRRQEAGNQPND